MNRILALCAVAAAVADVAWLAWSQLADATSPSPAKEAGHAEGEAGHDGEESSGKPTGEDADAHGSEAKVIVLSPEQRKEAGIAVEAVRPGPLPKAFRAPGEVRTNDFATNAITARHQAIIAERKAKLGDKVAKGQPLVGLFSAEMAEAQSAYILAVQESRRVQQLGRDVVAARRYDEAEARRRETRAKLDTFRSFSLVRFPWVMVKGINAPPVFPNRRMMGTFSGGSDRFTHRCFMMNWLD